MNCSRSLGPEEMEERRLTCGDAYSFQGDERDIIFLTMVSAPNARIGTLADERARRRFNVAVSRAKDQLWLFHTATSRDLSPTCVRRALLEYCANPAVWHTVADGAMTVADLERVRREASHRDETAAGAVRQLVRGRRVPRDCVARVSRRAAVRGGRLPDRHGGRGGSVAASPSSATGTRCMVASSSSRPTWCGSADLSAAAGRSGAWVGESSIGIPSPRSKTCGGRWSGTASGLAQRRMTFRPLRGIASATVAAQMAEAEPAALASLRERVCSGRRPSGSRGRSRRRGVSRPSALIADADPSALSETSSQDRSRRAWILGRSMGRQPAAQTLPGLAEAPGDATFVRRGEKRRR